MIDYSALGLIIFPATSNHVNQSKNDNDLPEMTGHLDQVLFCHSMFQISPENIYHIIKILLRGLLGLDTLQFGTKKYSGT